QRLLKGFARTQGDFARQFRAAPDQASAEMLAHTLKGLAGNIGAAHLLEAVTQLEADMQDKRADETTEQHQARVQASLDITVHALQAVLADIDRLNRPRGDAADLAAQALTPLDDAS